MSDKKNISEAMAKMEREFAKIEAEKLLTGQRDKRNTPLVKPKESREKQISEQIKKQQEDYLEIIKFRVLICIISTIVTLIYILNLSEVQRDSLAEDTILWSLVAGTCLVAALKR